MHIFIVKNHNFFLNIRHNIFLFKKYEISEKNKKNIVIKYVKILYSTSL